MNPLHLCNAQEPAVAASLSLTLGHGGKSSDRSKNAKLELGFNHMKGLDIEFLNFSPKQVEKHIFLLMIKIT